MFMIPGWMDNYIYVVVGEDETKSVVIDPFDDQPVHDLMREEGFRVSHILATHFHRDHTQGISGLKETTDAVVVGPVGEGIFAQDQFVGEGDRFTAGPLELEVWETPGHTCADLTFLAHGPGAAWCGDTLFSAGCGRLFECEPEVMWESLQRLAGLPGVTRLFCGHEYTQSNIQFARTVDPENEDLQRREREVVDLLAQDRPSLPTTVQVERATNPFLRCRESAIRRALNMGKATDIDVFAELRARKDRF